MERTQNIHKFIKLNVHSVLRLKCPSNWLCPDSELVVATAVLRDMWIIRMTLTVTRDWHYSIPMSKVYLAIQCVESRYILFISISPVLNTNMWPSAMNHFQGSAHISRLCHGPMHMHSLHTYTNVNSRILVFWHCTSIVWFCLFV